MRPGTPPRAPPLRLKLWLPVSGAAPGVFLSLAAAPGDSATGRPTPSPR